MIFEQNWLDGNCTPPFFVKFSYYSNLCEIILNYMFIVNYIFHRDEFEISLRGTLTLNNLFGPLRNNTTFKLIL